MATSAVSLSPTQLVVERLVYSCQNLLSVVVKRLVYSRQNLLSVVVERLVYSCKYLLSVQSLSKEIDTHVLLEKNRTYS